MKQPVLRSHDPVAVAAARDQAPGDALLTCAVETFQALADPTRVRLLYALATRPLSVRDLAMVVGVSESAVSHQLRILRDRRLVKPRRRGTMMVYAVDDAHVAALFREVEYHADHVLRGLLDHPEHGQGEEDGR